jgi:putative FmdB family regulatory protein
MPTYTYVCRKCGHRVEAVQSMSDPPLTTCGVCGGELRKVFTPPAIAFKGSGFYATDSRSKKKEPAASGAGKDSKTESKTDSKQGSKQDSKSDSRKESTASKESGSSTPKKDLGGSGSSTEKSA